MATAVVLHNHHYDPHQCLDDGNRDEPPKKIEEFFISRIVGQKMPQIHRPHGSGDPCESEPPPS